VHLIFEVHIICVCVCFPISNLAIDKDLNPEMELLMKHVINLENKKNLEIYIKQWGANIGLLCHNLSLVLTFMC
jgi:hypothetical protein